MIERDKYTNHFTDEEMLTLEIELELENIKHSASGVDGTQEIPREELIDMIYRTAVNIEKLLYKTNLPRGIVNEDADKVVEMINNIQSIK